MNEIETKLFRLLDEYSKEDHRCFVSELFLNPTGEKYLVCFRTLETENTDPYDCRYLHLPQEDGRSIVEQNRLSPKVKELLDKLLTSLKGNP